MKLLELAGETVRPGLYDEPFPLSYVVGRNAGLDLDAKQALLEAVSEDARLATLSAHLGRLLVRIREARKISTLARGDGHATGFPEPDNSRRVVAVAWAGGRRASRGSPYRAPQCALREVSAAVVLCVGDGSRRHTEVLR